MIRITAVTSGQSYILQYAQMYTMEGKNRIFLRDYSTLRTSLYGSKMAPLMIEGFWTFMEDEAGKNFVQNMKEFKDFINSSKDRVGRMDQFIIETEAQGPNDDTQEKERMSFRGVFNGAKYNANLESNMLWNYSVKFLVNPYGNLKETISNVYWWN